MKKKHGFGVLVPDAFLGNLFLLVASPSFTRKKTYEDNLSIDVEIWSKILFYFSVIWFAEMEKPIYISTLHRLDKTFLNSTSNVYFT
jgi:hypothetical protein